MPGSRLSVHACGWLVAGQMVVVEAVEEVVVAIILLSVAVGR